MSGPAYKLIDRDEWAAARTAGAYAGSAVDRADGYIHMSTKAQLAETARRHYAGRSGLMLLEVDIAALGPGRGPLVAVDQLVGRTAHSGARSRGCR